MPRKQRKKARSPASKNSFIATGDAQFAGGKKMDTWKRVKTLIREIVPADLVICMAAFFLTNCTARGPVPVGFVAQLTGVQAALGVQERNGVRLAVEEINRAGGISGRPVKLVIRDDLGTPEGAKKADRELIGMDVVAIIGHATSGQTMAGLTVTGPARVLMLSPTASTSELSGKDDYFFRVCYSLADRAHAFSRYIYQKRKITRIAVVYDTDNAAYSKNFMETFTDKYRSLGGKLTGKASFSSKSQPGFASLVKRLRTGNPGGLLIIASDIDTALIAQRTRLAGWPVPLFTTAWAQTETLINNGGRAVEGLEIEVANTYTDQKPAYLDFKKRYMARFSHTPSFGASLGYEAARVLAAALEKTGGRAGGLKKALTGIKNFKGLSETFSFDRYGDVIRSFYMGVIHQKKYMDIKSFKP